MAFGACNYSPQYKFLIAIPLPDLSPYSVNFNDDKLLLYYTVGAVLTVAGVVGFQPAGKLLSNKLFAYLGKISFSAYLLHWPVILSFSFWVVKEMWTYTRSFGLAVLVSFVTTVMVIFLLSILFFRYVDEPSIRFSNWLKDFMLRKRTSSDSDGARQETETQASG